MGIGGLATGIMVIIGAGVAMVMVGVAAAGTGRLMGAAAVAEVPNDPFTPE